LPVGTINALNNSAVKVEGVNPETYNLIKHEYAVVFKKIRETGKGATV
jgi:hypothetical protein